MKRITVLVVDDHTDLRKVLELDNGLEVIGEAQNGGDAAIQARQLRPNAVVMNSATPLLDGLEVIHQILEAAPEARVFVLSALDSADVRKVATVGATGFFIKHTASKDMCLAIRVRESQEGSAPFSSLIFNHFDRFEPRISGTDSGRPSFPLTSREVEVLQLIAEGRSNKLTASELSIGLKTVEKHREHLMKKLDIHDTAGLTRYAISTGLIEAGMQPAAI